MGELEIPYWRGEYRVESGASDTSRRKMGVPTPSPRGRGLEKPDNRIPWASIKYLIGEVRTERDVGGGGGGVTFRRKGGVPPSPRERTGESRQEDPLGELEVSDRRGEYRVGCGGDTCQREGDVRPPPVPDLKSILDQIRYFRLLQTNI